MYCHLEEEVSHFWESSKHLPLFPLRAVLLWVLALISQDWCVWVSIWRIFHRFPQVTCIARIVPYGCIVSESFWNPSDTANLEMQRNVNLEVRFDCLLYNKSSLFDWRATWNLDLQDWNLELSVVLLRNTFLRSITFSGALWTCFVLFLEFLTDVKLVLGGLKDTSVFSSWACFRSWDDFWGCLVQCVWVTRQSF